MHTHDRTLVQQLGADKDHKTAEHDAATLYLQAHAIDLISYFPRYPSGVVTYRRESIGGGYREFLKSCHKDKELCDYCSLNYKEDITFHPRQSQLSVSSVKTSLEVLLMSGRDKYARHVGFVDLRIEWLAKVQLEFPGFQTSATRKCRPLYHMPETQHDENLTLIFPPFIEVYPASDSMSVEVKTTPTPIGDVIRQFKLYRMYSRSQGWWVLATTYPVSEQHATALKNEGIHHYPIPDSYVSSVPTGSQGLLL